MNENPDPVSCDGGATPDPAADDAPAAGEPTPEAAEPPVADAPAGDFLTEGTWTGSLDFDQYYRDAPRESVVESMSEVEVTIEGSEISFRGTVSQTIIHDSICTDVVNSVLDGQAVGFVQAAAPVSMTIELAATAVVACGEEVGEAAGDSVITVEFPATVTFTVDTAIVAITAEGTELRGVLSRV